VMRLESGVKKTPQKMEMVVNQMGKIHCDSAVIIIIQRNAKQSLSHQLRC
jgi:hypothetical protein